MARTNRKVKKRRQALGLPTMLVLLAGRGGVGMNGWRTMVVTEGSAGMVCGSLGDLPSDAAPAEVQRAAVERVRWMAREFHGQEVAAIWEPQTQPGSWAAVIVVVDAGAELESGSGPGTEAEPGSGALPEV